MGHIGIAKVYIRPAKPLEIKLKFEENGIQFVNSIQLKMWTNSPQSTVELNSNSISSFMWSHSLHQNANDMLSSENLAAGFKIKILENATV